MLSWIAQQRTSTLAEPLNCQVFWPENLGDLSTSGLAQGKPTNHTSNLLLLYILPHRSVTKQQQRIRPPYHIKGTCTERAWSQSGFSSTVHDYLGQDWTTAARKQTFATSSSESKFQSLSTGTLATDYDYLENGGQTPHSDRQEGTYNHLSHARFSWSGGEDCGDPTHQDRKHADGDICSSVGLISIGINQT